MTVQLTDAQLTTLINRLVGAAGGASQGAASAVGPMEPCNLGIDKVKRLKNFQDWCKEAEAKITYMGINEDTKKVALLKSWAGRILLNFWEKEARIHLEKIPGIPAAGEQVAVPEVPADTFEEIIRKTKAELLKHVSRDRSLTDLLQMKQGDDTWMQFVSDVEDAADLCRLDTKPLTREDAIRVAALAGMRDRNLAEKALSEEFSLTKLISVGTTRETSRSNVEAMEGSKTGTIKRIPVRAADSSQGGQHQLAAGIILEGEEISEDALDAAISNLTVMKMKKAGKYSVRHKGGDRPTCDSCSSRHEEGRCPARGKTCFDCDGKDHFAKAKICTTTSKKSTKKVTKEEEGTDSDEFYGSEEEVRKVSAWPGYSSRAKRSGKNHFVGKVASESKEKDRHSRWVHIRMGGRRMNLFSDTGSHYTIIPPDLYRPSMGKVVAADTILRSWGSKKPLDVKGMFTTDLVTRRGARKQTQVYVVAGHRPEPLLGDADAEDLGFVTFDPQGRKATEKEDQLKEEELSADEKVVKKIKAGSSIPDKIRDGLGVQVITGKEAQVEAPASEIAKTMLIVDQYKGSVFNNHIGLIKTDPIKYNFDPKFKPTQPPYHPVPLHYKDKLSQHLAYLREEGVITDVDPRQPYDCVLNVVITDKATPGEIRMNVDSVPMNGGMQRTKFHVKQPQEVRHSLQGARVFSEMDMSMGFHQLPLAEESKNRSIIQTHEGLHRMERVFFGPTSTSGIFHHEVEKALRGVEGCTTIHDNILVYGKDHKTHRENLKQTLQRCKEKGITLKMSKSNFCKNQVTWFGRVYSGTGVSADPVKIKLIRDAGRPTSTDEVRSLIQAAAYNVKFAFDHQQQGSYEDTTAPLRELLVKGARFSWNNTREEAYRKLMKMMSAATTLRPFNPSKATHFVSDASPKGIQASLYQEEDNRTWVPVDHVSRALSVEEQNWGSQIDWESLAKSWGMQQFRYFLSGCKFTSWGDQQPLIPLYNNLSRPSSVRIAKHRQKIQDLVFCDKYMKGSENPCDYGSRHPEPISHLSKAEREKHGVDDGEEVFIRRLFMSDLPDAVTLDMLHEAAEKDPTYKQLREAVRQGKKPDSRELVPYMSVWTELGVVDDLVCRGDRLVVPSAELGKNTGDIRTWLADIAHDGHHGEDAMKRYLRVRLWFPGMDKMIERRASGCLGCLASNKQKHRDPLKPTKVPTLPWQKLAVDHWGPTRDNKHILVMVDVLSRYPEVEVVKGTSSHDNIVAFDSIFCRHGFPDVVYSDNGAPFNGKARHELKQYFAWAGIKHQPNYSAYDPEANGLAEAFMKHIVKIWHTSLTEHKDPMMEINKHLRVQRATPHISTGKPPAEMLFGRKYKSRLPDIRPDLAMDRQDIKEAVEQDRMAKERQKKYKDLKAYVKDHSLKPGDTVLLERKKTKYTTPYDPSPWTVRETHGSQITATRDKVVRTRDAQQWKKVDIVARRNYDRDREVLASRDEEKDYFPDIGGPDEEYTGAALVRGGHGAQEEAQEPAAEHQEPAVVPAPATPAVKERWSFTPPQSWQPQPQRKPLTRSVSARRNQEKIKLHSKTRGKGTGSMNREEGRQ